MEKSFCADPFRAHLDALSGAVNLLVDGVSGGVRYFGDTPEVRRKLVAHLAAQLVKVYGIIDSSRQRYEAVIGSETVDCRKDVRKRLQALKTRVDNDTDAEMKPYAARVLQCIEQANDVLLLGPLCQDEPIPAGSKAPAHFTAGWDYTTAQLILSELKKEGFISADTDVDTFYYRMTGSGRPNQGRIEWVRKAKNGNISLAALIDFVTSGGTNIEIALRFIPEVFCIATGPIHINPKTKSSARSGITSQFHERINAILGNYR